MTLVERALDEMRRVQELLAAHPNWEATVTVTADGMTLQAKAEFMEQAREALASLYASFECEM